MDNSQFGRLGCGVDKTRVMAVRINPDDIESITVLRRKCCGTYGSVVEMVFNIVTKRGTSRKGIGVEFNSNLVFETVNNLSELQKTFGAGAHQGGVPTKPASAQDAFNWGGSSWGTRLDGSPTIGIDGVSRPYSYAGDNWDRYYETGKSWTNSIAITGGGDKQNFRFGVSDLRSTGVIPNSGYDRLNLSFSTDAKLGKKLSFNAKILYSNEYAKNRPTVSDSPGMPCRQYGSVRQTSI